MIITIPRVLTFHLEDFIRLSRKHDIDAPTVTRKRFFGIVKEETAKKNVYEIKIHMKMPGVASGENVTTLGFDDVEKATVAFDSWSKIILEAQAAQKAEQAAKYEVLQKTLTERSKK